MVILRTGWNTGPETLHRFKLISCRAEPYVTRGPNPARTDPRVDFPTDSSDAEDLWLDLHRDGAGWLAAHNLGVTFYGQEFGDLPSFYRQS